MSRIRLHVSPEVTRPVRARLPASQAPGQHGHSGAGALAAGLGLVTTLATGATCVLPLLAILLGVGGFGWLTRYAYLQVPASVLTLLVLAYGFHRVYGRVGRRACEAKRPRDRLFARFLLWTATALALAINLFEYVVLPRL